MVSLFDTNPEKSSSRSRKLTATLRKSLVPKELGVNTVERRVTLLLRTLDAVPVLLVRLVVVL